MQATFHWRATAAEIAKTRPNLDEAQFIAALAGYATPETARWLREELDVFFDPLTPHPDDQLLAPDFCDPDDITDLINSFIRQHALDPAKVAEVHAAPEALRRGVVVDAAPPAADRASPLLALDEMDVDGHRRVVLERG